MQNGDQYFGKVQSLGPESLVLQSDVLGTLHLPRSKVALITLGTNPPVASATSNNAPKPPAPKPASTNASPGVSPSLRDLGTNSGLIHQVEAQFLSGAGPEAKAKFDELMSGLASGTIDMNALRAEAKKAADQVRAMRKDTGEGTGWTVDAYLAILDRFLKETAPADGTTNKTASKPAAQSGQP